MCIQFEEVGGGGGGGEGGEEILPPTRTSGVFKL